MAPTLTRLTTAACVATLIAIASGLDIQAQLPQAVGTWSVQGTIAEPRVGAASVVLDDGRTLILGGQRADGSVTDSVVIYDPVTNGTSGAGQLFAPRVNAAAARLEDGRVVVSGGQVGGAPSADIEIFDPVAGTSTFAATMAAPRAWHAAARLADNRVLIVGGATPDGSALATAEIFDPATSSVSPAGSMAAARMGLSATTLIEGRVLVVGGRSTGMQDLATAEIFDPFSGDFLPVSTSLGTARAGHTALLLPHNGGVLIAGGTAAGSSVTASDLFLPAIFPDPYSWGMGAFSATGAMTAPRAFGVSGPAGDNGFAYVAGGGSADVEGYRFATIKTDKADYYPGDPAVITGSGWQPGEEVSLIFQEDPAVHDDYTLTLTADTNGNIYWDQWAPDWHDLGVRFYLTAQDSRSHAQITFTDAPRIGAVTLGAQTPNPLANTASNTASYSVTTQRLNNGTVNGTFSLAFTGPTPAGITWSFSPSTFTANGANAFPTATLTFTTNGTTPAGSYNFTVTAADGGDISTGGAGTLVVSAGAATKLAFDQQPTSTTVATSISPAVTVRILDGGNNLVATDTRNVTLAIGVNPSGGALSGTTTVAATGGIATFSGLSINNAGNGYTLAASSVPALATATSNAFNIGKANQTISFAPLGTQTFGNPDFAISATSTSGLSVSFSSQTAGVCSVAGTSVHIISAGTCTMRASQPGNANYNAASDVDQSFTVLRATPVITWPTPAAITYPTALSAVQLNATADVAGTFTYTPAAGTLLNAGNGQALSVAFSPADTTNYNDVPSTTVSIDVLKGTPVITWPTPADISYPTALGGTQLNASSTVAGTFTYTPAAGTTLSAGNGQTLSVAFTPTDTANYNAVPSTTVLINVLKATPVITWPTPAAITYPTALSAVQLNATADVAGTFTYTPAAGTVLNAGNGQTLSVAFTPTDAANYNAVPSTTVLIDVLKGTPIITWPTPADITYPTVLGATQLNASANVAGTFTYTPAAGTTLSAGDDQTLSVAFTPTDTANYNAVPSTTVLIDVLKGTPTISWPTPAAITYPTALSGVQLNATADVAGTFTYTPAAGTVLSAGNGQVLSVAFSPADTANYNEVPSTTVSIDVLKGTPIITWPTPADITYPNALGATQLNASANVAGTFTYTPAAGTILSPGNGQTLSVAFTPTDSANYNAVPSTTVLINVLKGTPVITWPTPAAITYPTPLGAAQLNASANVDGTFTYTPAAGTVLNAGNGQTLAVAFTPTDTANYNAVPSTTVLINVLKGTPVITWPNPADITYPTALGNTQLNATASVDGTFTYTPAAGTVLNAGNGQTLSVAFTPTDTTNYNAVPVTSALINVLKATPVITWPTPAAITYPAALGATQLNASANVAGTFTYTPAAGTVLNAGNGQVLSVAFAPADVTNYNAVPVTTVHLNVLPRVLTVTATGVSRVYDGTTAATVTLAHNAVAGDNVTVTYGAASFADKNAGNGKPVSVTGIAISGGADAANYTLNGVYTASTTANITQRVLTVTGITANNKPFDGNSTATLNFSAAMLVGVISPDVVSLNTTAATGTFVQPAPPQAPTSAVGTWTVVIAGLTLSGGDGGNYILTQPTTTASIGAWTLSGFFQPVGIPSTYPVGPGQPVPAPASPLWNAIKGGQTVPLKFRMFSSVSGTELTSVTDVSGFGVAPCGCSGGAEELVEPELTTAGSTVLRYADGQFIVNWDTPKGANKCYRVTMTARDGSQLHAFFKTK